jgi:putative hydrolase of the HAD superfamily
MPASRGRPLGEIETWIFDLDNTLYPASCMLYVQVEQRMNEFIMQAMNVDLETAVALRRKFYLAHGTTLRGLMLEYDFEPSAFLEYCHTLDLSPVPKAPELVEAIAALPGRKVIFTNGTYSHAERLLAHLDLTPHFSFIHDIIACNYIPKPDVSGYRMLLEQQDIDPTRSAMVEDMAKNLVPAAALGMTTVWIKGGPHLGDSEGDHIHHEIEDLTAFLNAVPRGPIPVREP